MINSFSHFVHHLKTKLYSTMLSDMSLFDRSLNKEKRDKKKGSFSPRFCSFVSGWPIPFEAAD